jgi:hypothetical protein
MFDFGKNDENLTEKKVKEYFKENNFFGLQSYTVNFEAKELIIFAKNFVVKNETERKKVEKYFGERKETDFEFPFSIGVEFGVVFYSKRIKDFAMYVPNTKAIHLYLFLEFKPKKEKNENKIS